MQISPDLAILLGLAPPVLIFLFGELSPLLYFEEVQKSFIKNNWGRDSLGLITISIRLRDLKLQWLLMTVSYLYTFGVDAIVGVGDKSDISKVILTTAGVLFIATVCIHHLVRVTHMKRRHGFRPGWIFYSLTFPRLLLYGFNYYILFSVLPIRTM